MTGLGVVDRVVLGLAAAGASIGIGGEAIAARAAPAADAVGQGAVNLGISAIVVAVVTLLGKNAVEIGALLRDRWKDGAERHKRELADKQKDREFRLELEKQANARHEFREELGEMKVLASSLAAIVAPLLETVETNRRYLEKIHAEQGIPLPEGFRNRPFDALLPKYQSLIDRVKDEAPRLDIAAKEVLSKGLHPNPGTRPPSSDDIPRADFGTNEWRALGHDIPKGPGK